MLYLSSAPLKVIQRSSSETLVVGSVFSLRIMMEITMLGSKVIKRSNSQALVVESFFHGDYGGDHEFGVKIIQRSNFQTWVMGPVLYTCGWWWWSTFWGQQSSRSHIHKHWYCGGISFPWGSWKRSVSILRSKVIQRSNSKTGFKDRFSLGIIMLELIIKTLGTGLCWLKTVILRFAKMFEVWWNKLKWFLSF